MTMTMRGHVDNERWGAGHGMDPGGANVAHHTRRVESAAEHPLHASLVRPVLYLGVERTVIALEATLSFALLFGVGPSVATVGLVVLVLVVVHPTMAWLTAKDAMATEIFVRSRAYDDYYAPHAVVADTRHTAARPRRSIPKA